MPKATKRTKRAGGARARTEENNEPVSEGVSEHLDPTQGLIWDDMADDTYVLVGRVHPVTKQHEHLGRVAPSEATVEFIQERCGGGTFTCREKVRTEEGSMVYGRQRRFQIGGSPFPSDKINLAKTHKVEEVSAADSSLQHAKERTSLLDDEISSIIKGGIINMMQSQQEMTATQIAALKGLIEAGQKPKGDDSTLMMVMEMMKQNTQIMVAMMQNKPEAPDPTELMVKMADVWKGLSSPASSIADQLNTINEFIGVRQSIDDYHRGPQDEPEDFMGFAMKRFDKLVELISASQSHEELKRNMAALPPAQSQPSPQPLQPQPEGAMWQHVIKGQIPKYVTLAQRNQNPMQAAEVDFGAMPDAAIPIVKELLSGENPLNEVIQAFPVLAPHAEWVNQYLGRMHQLAFPEAYQAPEATPEEQAASGMGAEGFGPQAGSEGFGAPTDDGGSGMLVMPPPEGGQTS